MPFELNFKNIFHDFNPSKFVVYGCLVVFCLLFSLRLDNFIIWSYWIIFLPIWFWKLLVMVGAIVGSYVWWRNPHYRLEGDACTQYKAMIICTGMHLLLFMFELLACIKLEGKREQVMWILVFIPLIFMAVVSIGICVWAVKHERTFEMELFCSVNILQFIFLALRLDEFIRWPWVIVFIPLWIVMCVALIGVLYAIILAIILLKSPDIIPEQKRGNLFSAVGYTCLVVPMLVFEILLVNKEDGIHLELTYTEVAIPLLISLVTLMLMSFGTKGGNQWWFGLRKDFCLWLLGHCPLLQEYGNISYKVQGDDRDNQEQNSDLADRPISTRHHYKRGSPEDTPSKIRVHVLSLDMPD
ncbi:hypothetical protein LSH36_562g01039 [Paralvinella palmiformis]|uniref:Transmembrane protein 185A n=1 Tax=Paralvinella palmiformis TaxID=53620 RepID=A0AAD9J6T6_9ANNE|nr:hypothetical protein LSH36_562g01039 [Paralvinella palmiformis]